MQIQEISNTRYLNIIPIEITSVEVKSESEMNIKISAEIIKDVNDSEIVEESYIIKMADVDKDLCDSLTRFISVYVKTRGPVEFLKYSLNDRDLKNHDSYSEALLYKTFYNKVRYNKDMRKMIYRWSEF